MDDKNISIQLKPLTAIWTGDALGKSYWKELKASSIIGTFRWWYEKLFSEKTSCCISTKNDRCSLDNKTFFKNILEGKDVDDSLKESGICSACRLFGCTGWSGKIGLIIKVKENKDIELNFIFKKALSNIEKANFLFCLYVVTNYAAIGARTSQGKGVVEVQNKEIFNNQNCDVISLNNKTKENFFFCKIPIEVIGGDEKNPQPKEIAKKIRKIIRRVIDNTKERHEIFGFVSGKERRGSKIFVSNRYEANEKKYELRIWGYDSQKYVNCIIEKLSNENKLGSFKLDIENKKEINLGTILNNYKLLEVKSNE